MGQICRLLLLYMHFIPIDKHFILIWCFDIEYEYKKLYEIIRYALGKRGMYRISLCYEITLKLRISRRITLYVKCSFWSSKNSALLIFENYSQGFIATHYTLHMKCICIEIIKRKTRRTTSWITCYIVSNIHAINCRYNRCS